MNGDSAINVTPRKELLKEAVHTNARDLGRLLIFSACLLFCVIVIKIQQAPTFEIATLKFATMHAWIVIAALSVFHQVLANYLNSSIGAFSAVASNTERRELFEEITISGPPFFRQFKPRVPVAVGSKLYRANRADPTVWLYFFVALLIPLASYPFIRQSYGPALLDATIGVYLLVWNWIVGTSWAIRLGNLTTDKVVDGQATATSKPPVKGFIPPSLIVQLIKDILSGVALLIFYVIGLTLVAIYVYVRILGSS